MKLRRSGRQGSPVCMKLSFAPSAFSAMTQSTPSIPEIRLPFIFGVFQDMAHLSVCPLSFSLFHPISISHQCASAEYLPEMCWDLSFCEGLSCFLHHCGSIHFFPLILMGSQDGQVLNTSSCIYHRYHHSPGNSHSFYSLLPIFNLWLNPDIFLYVTYDFICIYLCVYVWYLCPGHISLCAFSQ